MSKVKLSKKCSKVEIKLFKTNSTIYSKRTSTLRKFSASGKLYSDQLVKG